MGLIYIVLDPAESTGQTRSPGQPARDADELVATTLEINLIYAK